MEFVFATFDLDPVVVLCCISVFERKRKHTQLEYRYRGLFKHVIELFTDWFMGC